MREQGWGKIVNVSSMGGRFTFPGGGLYHATKYAIEALSDAMRFEVKGFGVDVILIEPGLIRTELRRHDGARDRAGATAVDGPYADFNQAVGEATVGRLREGLRSPVSAVRPRRSRERIETALNADRPRARYTVTPSARALLTLQRAAARRGLGRDAAAAPSRAPARR